MIITSRSFTKSVLVFAFIVTISSLLFSLLALVNKASAIQTVPYKIGFQGRLTDAAGTIKADGLYNMKIRLYGSASGGNSLGEEVRDGGYRVQVKNGLFSIMIGDNSSLSPAAFTTYPLYIEIELPSPATATCATVGCGTWSEGPMSPRSAIGSSPTVFNTDTVDGINGSSFARKDTNNTFSNDVTFNGKTQFNDTLSVINYGTLGFNSRSFQLQNAGTGAYLTSDYRGFSISAIPNDVAGSSAYNISTLRLVNNNQFIQAAVNGGVTNGDNLISNPGFEFGSAGWRFLNGPIAGTSESRTGVGSLKVQQPSATALLDSASNLIAVSPGDLLSYGGYTQVNNIAAGSGGFVLVYYNSQGDIVNYSSDIAYAGSLPNTSYNLRSGTDTVAPGSAYVELFATTRGDGSVAGTWHFDDVFVRKTSQSSSSIYRAAINSASAFEIQSAAGNSLLIADTSTNTLRVGGGNIGGDTYPALFYVDNKSTNGDPAGRNGSMYYNVAGKKFRCFEEGGWKDCISSTPTIRDNYTYRQDFEGIIGVGQNSTGTIDSTLSAVANGLSTSVQSQGSETSRPGIYRLSSGSTSSGYAYVITKIQSGNTPYYPYRFGNGAIEISSSMRVATLATSTQNFIASTGISSNLATTPNGCYLQHSFTAGNNWTGVCATNGTISTCDTTVPVSVGTWYDLKVAINANATTAVFVVNNNSATSCTVSSNIPTSADMALQIGVTKTGGLTARTIDVDYVELTYSISGR